MSGGVFFYYLGVKKGLFISFFFEALFGFAILFYGLGHPGGFTVVLLVVMADYFCNVGW